MIPRSALFALVTGIFFCGFATGTSTAQMNQDPDWPCIQAFVPTVSAAVVWDGPSVDGMEDKWRREQPLATLVKRLTDSTMTTEKAANEIAAFAKTLKKEDKNQQLTMLFNGVLETLNGKRRTMVEGIRRFTRHQRIRAKQIEERMLEFDRMSQDPAVDEDKFKELSHAINTQARIFEDREKMIQYVCERPVKDEEKLGELSHAISTHLD